jgi:hypothetical protein
MSMWNDVKKTVKDGFVIATEKTEEYTKIAKVKVDILTKKRDLDKAYHDLGEITYTHLTSGEKASLAQDKGVKALLDTIKRCQNEITNKEAEIEQIKKAAESKSKAKATAKSEMEPEAAPDRQAPPASRKAPAKK